MRLELLFFLLPLRCLPGPLTPYPQIDCTAELTEKCKEELSKECEETMETVCDDDEEEVCEERDSDCDQGGEVVTEVCEERVREECSPVTEKVCETQEKMECVQRKEEECMECREVMEEEEVTCEKEEEVCEEMMKPVCSKNSLNCTGRGAEDSVITFSDDEAGSRKVELTGFIGDLIRDDRGGRQLDDEDDIPTMTVTRDDLNNVLDVKLDGKDPTQDGCVVVK